MTSATHLISVERGHDPRDFALVAGGGAGPLHAVEIARELRIPQVVVPPDAGRHLGARHPPGRPAPRPAALRCCSRSRTSTRRLGDDVRAARWPRPREILEAEDIPADRRSIELSVDARYYGQTPYMNLKLDEPLQRTRRTLEALVAQYRERYEPEFGYQLPEDVATVEIVNARVAAIGLTEDVELQRGRRAAPRPTRRASRSRAGLLRRERATSPTRPIYDRTKLGAGADDRRARP